MKISLKEYELQLKHTFRISRDSYNTRSTLVVSIDHEGKTGYGEATSHSYYNSTVSGMMAEIETVRETLETTAFETPEIFYELLKDLNLSNFARCALDLAANDLYGKLKNTPLYTLWGTCLEKYPLSNYTIGIGSIDEMAGKIKEKPWPVYKIKLGTSQDLKIIKELRKHTNAVFRVDANCAWTVAETIAIAPKLKKLGVEFIEQPLNAYDWEGMKKVKEKCVLPVIADESCVVEADVARCVPCFTGINIKLVKCGGLTPARRMIANARACGLKVMAGCMTESSVGISALAQLIPQLDYVDMDGAMLLKKDIAKGVKINDDGTVSFPSLGGSGVNLL